MSAADHDDVAEPFPIPPELLAALIEVENAPRICDNRATSRFGDVKCTGLAAGMLTPQECGHPGALVCQKHYEEFVQLMSEPDTRAACGIPGCNGPRTITWTKL